MGRKTHKKNHTHKINAHCCALKTKLKQWQQKLQYGKERARTRIPDAHSNSKLNNGNNTLLHTAQKWRGENSLTAETVANSERKCVRSPIPVEHAKIKPKKGDRTCNIERDNGCLLTASCKWQKQKRKFSHYRRSRATGKSNVQEHQFPLSNAQSNSRTCTSACSIERDEARHKNRRLEKLSLQT